MRKRASSGGMTVQAIAGTKAVYFGFDLTDKARAGCLGFAVHRRDHAGGKGAWLSAFKTFRSVVPVPGSDAIYLTVDHPIQSFSWGDYTVEPGHHYTYRIVPRYGTGATLSDHPGVEATIDIVTGDPAEGIHGVYFNRGVAASQAYQKEFGLPPDQLSDHERKAALAWLSRGLDEALLAFIAQASSGRFAIRAAFYEFTQPDVLAAFAKAQARGADIEIIYHAADDGTGASNDRAIDAAGLDRAILRKRTNAKIAHNKFMVLCTGDGAGLTPVSVWTGSTNISEGGIFGHSNVGHAVRDPAVAGRYIEYWNQLEGDPVLKSNQAWCSANSPLDTDALATAGIHTLFSPRTELAPLDWYASRFGGPKASAHITEAFGMSTALENELMKVPGNALHYVLLDKVDNNQAKWSADARVFVAVGSLGGADELSRWADEKLTGFNTHVGFCHTKILLVDPLGEDPTVITGSANFSPNSTVTNDENMLVIQGDRDVADVYFTEFARMFAHYYARWWASQLKTKTKGTGDAETRSFLDETDGWQEPYFAPGNRKQRQRAYLSSQVSGNV